MKTRILPFCSLILILGACGEKAVDVPAAAAQSATPPEPVVMPRSESAQGARVFFITPANGAVLTNPISIEFGTEGMEVVKAGIDQPHSGHHHLLIDTGLPDLGLPIPADENHVHFGDGRTATVITLPPGQHTLQMLLGDHLHIPHDPPVLSEVITVTVE